MMQTLHQEPMLTVATMGNLQLDNDKVVELRVCIAEFRAAQRRVANDFVIMSAQLSMMQNIIGEGFMSFARNELQLEPRMVKRYLQLHDIMSKRLATNGRIDLAEAQNFTQTALNLLGPITDTDVIDEIRSLARDGQTVDAVVVNKIIAARNVDYEARLRLAESEAAAATAKLAEERQRRQVEAAQNQNHITRQEEIIRRGQEQAAAFEEDVRRLEKQATVVTTTEIEVAPAEYLTIKEAIESAKSELEQVQTRTQAAQQEAEAAERIAQEQQRCLTAFRTETQDFMRVKSVVEEVMSLAPQAQLQAMASKDPDIKKAIQSMGEALVHFGQTLQQTVAKAA
jgi:hypothetical protein